MKGDITTGDRTDLFEIQYLINQITGGVILTKLKVVIL